MGGTRESRADSGVSCNGNTVTQVPKQPKPKVHNDGEKMPKEKSSTSVMNADKIR